MSIKAIPNQVFIGCPWRIIREKYERIIEDFKKRYSLSFIMIGREKEQEAEDLLAVIKRFLLSSTCSIFDASGGNPNVSLEFGIAEASGVSTVIYLNKHGAAKKESKDSAIISDLAGKRRKEYKQWSQLKGLLTHFSKNHNYTLRFEKFLKNSFKGADKGRKKRARALALKIVHSLDGVETRRRDDIVQNLVASLGDYKRQEIEAILSKMHKFGLIQITPGRYADVIIN